MHSTPKIHILTRAVIVDKHQILLVRNTDWKTEHYHLPGGHIEHGESAENALLRELDEEMGLHDGIKRFLGCLEYTFTRDVHEKACHTHEYNLLFEVRSHDLLAGILPAKKESNLVFKWIPIADLHTVSLLPEPLVHLIPAWLEQEHDAFYSMMVDKK